MKLTKIPRNIFQTWKTKNISNELNLLVQTWKIHNPNYAYFLFDDNECEAFIKKNFDKNIYEAYCRIIPHAFKADLWRYCILYVYGGVYVDIDTMCLSSLDNILDENIDFIVPNNLNNDSFLLETYNISNGFIASTPKHPILMECIKQIAYNLIDFSNLDFSGLELLCKSINIFMKNKKNKCFMEKEEIYNDNVKFLCFENNNECVTDISFENIIFKRMEKQYVYVKHNTIVTMFYKIHERKKNVIGSVLNRSIDKYIELAKSFILKLPYNLIVFTDEKEIIEMIYKERTNFMEKTLVINKPFEETYYYKHLDRLKELQQTFNIVNGHIEHETPMYIILNNDKFDFMEHAIQLNPFDSSHFIWMDFAINHVALNCEKIHEWIYCVPDKIKQLCINPYIENIDNKTMFQYIYHHTAGGLFTGSKENLLKYCKLFKEKTEEIYREEWYQIDEAVMTIVQRENPDLFDFFYGDYQGIISNYFSPIHNIDLILKGVQKYIDHNKVYDAFKILCYCDKFFIDNLNNNLMYDFIQKHIIVDYYNNNMLLTDNVISLIQHLKIIDTENTNRLLVSNASNIDFYLNKQLVL